MEELLKFKGNNDKAKFNRKQIIDFFSKNPEGWFDRQEIVNRTGVYKTGVAKHCDDLSDRNFLVREKTNRFIYKLKTSDTCLL